MPARPSKKGLLFEKIIKNFGSLASASVSDKPIKAKVFWFFFSKKNSFLV
jgi:hypothetical protein